MLEVKIAEIVNAYKVVNKLKELKDINISVAYEIRKLVKAIEEKAKSFEDARIATVTALGTFKTDNGDEMLLPEKQEEFVKQMEELLSKAEQLDITKLSFNSIKDSKGLTAGDLELLDAFIAY